jgi:hypothetical protein
MKIITMTKDQTALYDEGDEMIMRTLNRRAQALADASGESVEIYTDDGVLANVREPQ